jgi:hypothetical protein
MAFGGEPQHNCDPSAVLPSGSHAL